MSKESNAKTQETLPLPTPNPSIASNLPLNNIPNIPEMLRNIADGMNNGQIQSCEIKQQSNGSNSSLTITIDTTNDQRTIIQNHQTSSYTLNSIEHTQKPNTEERRKIVAKLHKEGLTQQEIAKRAMCSQKTVSNDLKFLNK